MTHIKEAWERTRDNTQAVIDGVAHTGRVITSAALIMVSVFFAFFINGDSTVKQFGVGMGVAVAVERRSCDACSCRAWGSSLAASLEGDAHRSASPRRWARAHRCRWTAIVLQTDGQDVSDVATAVDAAGNGFLRLDREPSVALPASHDLQGLDLATRSGASCLDARHAARPATSPTSRVVLYNALLPIFHLCLLTPSSFTSVLIGIARGDCTLLLLTRVLVADLYGGDLHAPRRSLFATAGCSRSASRARRPSRQLHVSARRGLRLPA